MLKLKFILAVGSKHVNTDLRDTISKAIKVSQSFFCAAIIVISLSACIQTNTKADTETVVDSKNVNFQNLSLNESAGHYIEDTSIEGRKAEIDEKVVKLRQSMKDKGFDAMLINKSEHFAWITAGGSNIVTRFVENGVCNILVTMDKLFYICNNIEALRMVEEEYLDQLGFEPRLMLWYENRTMEFVSEIVGSGKLASDLSIPGAADANDILLHHERVLCKNEIARYLHLGKVFSEVIESYMQTIRPGDTEIAIAGQLGAKMWENGLEPVLFLIAADERIYKHRHPIPTDKPVEKFLMICCNARYKGLITKITRMMHFGKASPELLEQYRQTIEIENACAAITRPGVDDIEILNLCKKMYADFGYPDMWKEHHQGGPQSYTNGFYLISDNRHEVIRLHQPYGYNPSIAGAITGTKTEDGFIVMEDGPLFITYPVSFPAIRSSINGKEYVRPGILEIE